MHALFRLGWCLLVLVLLPCPAPTCSLCGPIAKRNALAEEMEQAVVVVCGKLANPKLNSNPEAAPGSGTTELHVDKVVKADAGLRGVPVITLPRYLPVLDPKNPPRFLVCFRRTNGELEVITGREVKSPAFTQFTAELAALPSRDVPARLAFAARYLDASDSAVADEAFLEFARASDAELAKAARNLSPARLRKLLQARPEAEKMSLFGYMLGACGGDEDATLLRGLIDARDDYSNRGFEGLLAGYIALRPEDGWKRTHAILANEKEPFLRRYGAIRTVRFYHQARPTETQAQVLRGLELILAQAEFADMAVNDLRSWKIWSCTPQVLAQYDRPSHDSPIIKNSIVRYALACPDPQARTFVERVRREDPPLVRDLEEDLAYEAKR